MPTQRKVKQQPDEWVIVGRFGRPRGIKGFVKVISFTEPRENILQYEPWYARIDKQWQPLNIKQVSIEHKFIFAQIEGFPEREQAANLTNIDIAIKQEQLPDLEPGEYYWHQLIGMTVVNLQNIVLGTVAEMIATGANDVLVVTGEKRYLIPFVPEKYVIRIDNKSAQVVVDWDVDF